MDRPTKRQRIDESQFLPLAFRPPVSSGTEAKMRYSAYYPAQKARQGAIILQKPWQRAIFIAGLAGAVFLLLISGLAF
jgi:hypothetical protein